MRGFIITLCFVLGLTASAQIPGMPNNLLSPNAASLGEYGEVPVSLYTGIPDINIPLYTIELGEYSVPISMSYHAGGVKPDQHVGWTGLGWTLNAGGCISRKMNGDTDEYHNPDNKVYIFGPSQEKGFYYHHSAVDFNWSNDTILESELKNHFLENDSNKYYDTEPDLFTFNFLDYHGCFYMNTSGEWKAQCNKPIKVLFENDFTTEYSRDSNNFKAHQNVKDFGRPHSFKKFTLIGEDGTKYIFGDDESAIEYSMDFFSQEVSPFIAGSWYLTKIIFPNKREVKFTYSRGSYIVQMYCHRGQFRFWARSDQTECYFGGETSAEIYQGQLILPTYLFRIDFDGGYLELTKRITADLTYDFDNLTQAFKNKYINAGTTPANSMPVLCNNGSYSGIRDFPNCLNGLKWQKLSEIFIKNSESKIIKKFTFDYNESSTERLTLKSIKETNDASSLIGRTYQFEYYRPDLLPEYASYKTDHWGFYNDTNADFDSSLPMNTMAERFYQYREPNPNVALYGMLTKITYPTGGFTKFIYEPHDYLKQVNSTRTGYESLSTKKYAGGLRIKRIVNSPSGLEQDTCTTKEYFYVSDFLTNKENATKSSGVLCQRAAYYFNNHNIKDLIDWITFNVEAFSSQSVLQFCDNTHGTHMGYSQVVERLADGSFTIYQYSNFDTGNVDTPCDFAMQGHTIYEPYCSRDQERGLLLSKTEYDNNSNKTRSTCYTYDKDRPESDFIKALSKNLQITQCGNLMEITAYRNFLYTMRPTLMKDTVFRDGKAFTSETAYSYNNNRLLSQSTQSMEDDKIIRNTYKYPDSFVAERSTMYQEMCDSNRVSPVIEQIVEEIAADGTIYPVKKTRYHYDDNIVKPSSIDIAYGANSYEKAKKFEYDCFFNPIREYNYSIGENKFFIWGYKGLYPVAVIEGASSTSIIDNDGINSFAKELSPDMSKIEALRSSISGSLITSLYYTPLVGMTKRIEPNGATSIYEYDAIGRLIRIKDSEGNIIRDFRYNFAK